jgi:Tfp pilus assembly protein PilE
MGLLFNPWRGKNMKFSCPDCKLTGSIDDARLPEQGLYANCPKCKTRFLVRKTPGPDMPPDDFHSSRPPAGSLPDVRTGTNRENAEAVKKDSARPQSSERISAGRSARPSTARISDNLAKFIGNNSDKYIEKFDRFNSVDNGGFAATWHWPAFFVPFWWLIYRKQYLWAVLTFILSFVPLVGILSHFAFGLTGYYIYYGYSKRKLLEINLLPSEMSKAVEIARAGGVNNLAWVVAPLIGIAVAGILAAIAIPQFAAYRVKAYNSVAVQELTKAKAYVDDYYRLNNTYPETLEEANYPKKEKVDVHISFQDADKYIIMSSHQNGDKEYAVTSDSPDLLCRSKKDQGDFVPIKGFNGG